MEKYDEKDVIRLQRMIRRWLKQRKTRNQSKKNIITLKKRRDIWHEFVEDEKNYFMKLLTIVSVKKNKLHPFFFFFEQFPFFFFKNHLAEIL